MHATFGQLTTPSFQLTTQKPPSLGQFPRLKQPPPAMTAPGAFLQSTNTALCVLTFSRLGLHERPYPCTHTGLCRQLEMDENYASQAPVNASWLSCEQPLGVSLPPAHPSGRRRKAAYVNMSYQPNMPDGSFHIPTPTLQGRDYVHWFANTGAKMLKDVTCSG